VTEYLSTDDVIDLYEVAVRATGDIPQGLRDRGILESAVMRPQFMAHYQDADLFQQAAALAHGISRSQAFVDGNKRAGLQAVSIFLRVNGYRLPRDRMPFARLLLEVADPDLDPGEAETRLADWLRAHTAPA
jgi:death-on-curing protein